MEASVARCLRTPPDAAKRQGLKSAFQTALRGLSHRSIVVVGNYCYGPITAEPYRAKASPLHPRRSYFAPISCPPKRGGLRKTRPQPDGQMVEAPGTAPGSDRFIATAIYRHSRQAGLKNIGADRGGIKCSAPLPARGEREARRGSAERVKGPSWENNAASLDMRAGAATLSLWLQGLVAHGEQQETAP